MQKKLEKYEDNNLINNQCKNTLCFENNEYRIMKEIEKWFHNAMCNCLKIRINV